MSAVLAVRPSSLGDVVYALALADDLARHRPGFALDWVAEEAFVALPRLCPLVRNVIPLALRRWRHAPARATTWREIGAFRTGLRAERYDAILDLQEQVKGSLIARAARGVRHGYDRASVREPIATFLDDALHPVNPGWHLVQRCRALAAAALGYPLEGAPRWRWQLPAPPASTPARPFVVAVHATSRADKHWPVEHWRALLEGPARAGYAVVLPFGTADEEAKSRAIDDGIGGAVVPPRLALDAIAPLLARADAVVGIDTGLTHFAATLGAPTLALFTSTDPALAGVFVAGAHARDLGGNGAIPSVGEARDALGVLLRGAPRC